MSSVHRFLVISRLVLGFAAAGLGLSAQTTFYDWQPTVFAEADWYNEAVSGVAADPDLDGLRNLEEFVFFTPPLSANSATFAPRLEQVGSNLTLTFRKRQGLADVDIRLQGSDTLTSWITYNSVAEVDHVAFSGYDEVTLLDPQPYSNAAPARRFLRLRLETPVPTELRPPVQLSLGVAPAAPQSWSVSWTDPNGFETGHRIERRLLADGTWQEVGSTAADTGTFTHTTADYQQSLTYRVSALASGGKIATSTPVSLPDTDGDGIPDALELQTAYNGVEGTFASDPNSFSSNGSGVSDGWQAANGYNPASSFNGQVDSDGDGLSDYEEYKLGTNPRKKDSDDDGIEDPLDGWAMVSALAPVRLEAPTYALIPIGPAGSYATEINNNGQALIKNLIGDWCLLNGGITSPLQAPPGRSFSSVYELRDDGGLLAATESSDTNPLTVNTWKRSSAGDWIACSAPQSLVNIEFSSSEGYPVSVEALGPDGIVYGSAATGVVGGGGYASIFGAYSWNNGSVEKIGDQLGYAYGETLNGFLSTYTSDVMSLFPTTVLYQYAADGSTFVSTKVNDKNIKVSKKDTYNGFYVFSSWSGDSTTGGTESHSLVLNFGEVELFEFSNGGTFGSFAVTNRNTVILVPQDGQPVLWLDSKGGLRNDQSVDGSPTYTRLDWKTNYGEAPPLTLNPQMRGFDQNRIWQNALWYDLAPLVPATQGQNAAWGPVYISDQNDSGMLVGSAIKAADNKNYAVLLVPAALQVDANHDGVIDNSDLGQKAVPTQDNPYRFWSNDDIDGSSIIGEIEEDDKESGTKNCDDNIINGRRDLEDFARLNVYIGGLQDAILAGTLKIGLKWKNITTGAPEIKVWRNLSPNGGTEYLNDPAVAQQHLALTQPGYVHGTGTYIIPTLFWQQAGLSATQPTGYLLFEGCAEGKGQLVMTILKADGTEIGEGPGVYMDLQKPHKFIQRWTCGDGPLATVSTYNLDSNKSGTFGAPTKDEEKDMVLYVHGYNMQEYEKQRWIETTYKRLYWLGYKGRVGGFTWPCSDSFLPYDQSELRAWQSGVQLKNLLTVLKSQGYRVHVIGHSQGNVVVGEALRQAGQGSGQVSTYIASQAAIPGHCYNPQAELFPFQSYMDDGTPNVYARYWKPGSPDRWPENWPEGNPAYLAPAYMNGAAGKYVNYYNDVDYALTGTAIDHGAWELTNKLKPDGTEYVSYSAANGFRQRPGGGAMYFNLIFPDDRFGVFAYGAEARSRALGARETGGVFTEEVNLKTAFGFTDEHIYHSGQFRSFYAQRWQYWYAVLDACQLSPRANP